MSGRLSVAHRSLLVDVARRYYLDDKSKVDIASEFGMSRYRVARLLAEARECGVVSLTIHDQGTVAPELEAALVSELGLTEAVVVNVDADRGDALRRQYVAIAAADLLSRTLREGEVLGVAWGRTLWAMTEHLTALPGVSVVQLTGAVGGNLDQSPVEVVRRVASRSGGTAHPLFAPMVVSTRAICQGLRQQADVATALRLFSRVTTAVLALGSWDPLDSQLAAVIPPDERTALIERGVVAEVSSTLIGADGSLVAPDFAERCIAIDSGQLRRIPRVIVAMAGSRKKEAARAVLRAGLVTGVVTDREIAEALLDDRELAQRRRDQPPGLTP